MIRFDERTGYLHATDLGRTASQFYINHETIEVFNEMMKPVMKEDEILDMLSRAQESYSWDTIDNVGIEDQLTKVKIPGPSALALSALRLFVKPVLN